MIAILRDALTAIRDGRRCGCYNTHDPNWHNEGCHKLIAAEALRAFDAADWTREQDYVDLCVRLSFECPTVSMPDIQHIVSAVTAHLRGAAK